MKIAPILFIILRLILGGVMIFGGIQKFQKPMPTPVEVVEKAAQFKDPAQKSTLQKILYISGSKQTGYFWQLLGICELLFGLLLIVQYTSFIGAVFLLPITLNIFLFHVFLEADDIGELAQTGAFFAINIALVLKERNVWKPLLWLKPI
ncbi:MAG: DoxX family membrane protein [Bacteroidota bacterium]